MSHDLCIDADGKAEMMFVGDMPWHGLGTRLTEPPTAEEAIRAARLDWRVLKKQLFVGEEHRPLPGQYAVVREDRWNRSEEFRAGNYQGCRSEIGWSCCCTSTVQTVAGVLKNTPKRPATDLISQQHTQNWVDS